MTHENPLRRRFLLGGETGRCVRNPPHRPFFRWVTTSFMVSPDFESVLGETGGPAPETIRKAGAAIAILAGGRRRVDWPAAWFSLFTPPVSHVPC